MLAGKLGMWKTWKNPVVGVGKEFVLSSGCGLPDGNGTSCDKD